MKHFLAVLTIALFAVTTHGQLSSSNPTPAFHAAAPATTEKLPPILTEKQLAEQGLTLPAQKAAYAAAAKSSSLAYQMPCYCHCDRAHGHTSLRSCFEGTHGAQCGTCMQESIYTYRQSKKGWTAKMIRDGIMRGDFQMIDLQNVPPVQ